MYTIFGCGAIGSCITVELSKGGAELFVLDKDEAALEAIGTLGVESMAADMLTIDLSIPQVSNASVIAILTGDDAANLEALKRIKKVYSDKFVLMVSKRPEDSKKLFESGASIVVPANSIVSKSVLLELKNADQKRSAFLLEKVARGARDKGLAILLQNNPDPDAIASGLALKKLCEKFDVKSKLFYGGTISHQQNKALVNMLNVEMTQLKSENDVRLMVGSFDKVALVEASVSSKNNMLPEDVIPNIVIDHHPTDIQVEGEFVDIRPMTGSTSTIMTGYLRQFGIKIDSSLATALRYGIRVDTLGFTRNTTMEDLNAAAYLSPLIDMGMLSQIENPPMSLETFDIIGRAIRNKEIKGSYMISFVEFIKDRDALPQAAELMLQLEGVYTVLVFGIFKDKVQLSARSIDTRVNLGSLLQKAFGDMNAGGHQNMAAGAIDLGIFGDATDRKALLNVTFDAVRKKFFSVVGVRFEDDVTKDLDQDNNGSIVNN